MNKHPSNVSEAASNKPTSNATAFTLSGTVVDPFRTFTSALSNGETCPVHASNGTDWQDFIGTYSSGTLAQTTLLESSTGSWIDWSSGGDVQLEIAWLGAHGEDTDAHIASTSNPHGTTAAQVGADPTGTASAAVAAHVAAGNPHPQYFEDPSGTATVGQMIVQSSTGPKWVAYATALNCSVNPVVSGTTQYGNVLTCSTGTWAGLGSISYAYQWYNGATLLSGETANTYTSVIGDIGDTISCTVTATDTLTSVSANSNGIVVIDDILTTSEFYAPLTHSLVLTRGTGNPTYSRATAAWEFDNEGKLISVPSTAARFGGARMVRNQFATTSEDFSNAAWSKINSTISADSTVAPNATTTADKLVSASDVNQLHYLQQTVTTVVATYTFSVYLKAAEYTNVLVLHNVSNDGVVINLSTGATSGFAGIDLATNAVTSVGGGWYRVSITVEATAAANMFRIYLHNGSAIQFNGDGTSGIYVWGAQLENVTGQSDQRASEYVSVGVESAPYHGAGIDGVAYFDYYYTD